MTNACKAAFPAERRMNQIGLDTLRDCECEVGSPSGVVAAMYPQYSSDLSTESRFTMDLTVMAEAILDRFDRILWRKPPILERVTSQPRPEIRPCDHVIERMERAAERLERAPVFTSAQQPAQDTFYLESIRMFVEYYQKKADETDDGYPN